MYFKVAPRQTISAAVLPKVRTPLVLHYLHTLWFGLFENVCDACLRRRHAPRPHRPRWRNERSRLLRRFPILAKTTARQRPWLLSNILRKLSPPVTLEPQGLGNLGNLLVNRLSFAQMREEIPDDTANVRVVLCSKITNLVLLGWSSRGSSRA